MKKQRILFRVDGNRNIGLGHVSRCLALAELLFDDFEVAFAIRKPDAQILNDVKKVSHKVILLPVHTDACDINNELTPHLSGSEIVVLDGYAFTTEYEYTVKKKAAALISIDDISGRHFVADGIINFCGAIDPVNYSREFYTKLYLGLDYIFLRKPFLRTFPAKEKSNKMLLINMGGSDSGNETEMILNQILEKGFSGEIVVVIGNSYPFREALESIITGNHFITLQQGLSADEMYKTMSQCGIAILPPSTVALEFLSTGGLLFVKQTATNQECIKKHLLKEQLAFDYSRFWEYVKDYANTSQSDCKGSFFNSTYSAFDGKSLQRIKGMFNSLSLSIKMSFRRAAIEDAKIVYNWAVDPEARKYSYSKSEIAWEDHVQWFSKKISGSICEYFIAEIDSIPIGQIRFDLSDDEPETYIVSYLMGKDWRGKGLGNSLLTKGIQNLMTFRSVRKIIGYVQDHNIASAKAFDHACFKSTVSLKYPDSSKFELLL